MSMQSRIRVTVRWKRALKGGSYSHFPAQILTKSHRLTAQIPSSLCLSCSNLNPIPIFYCFFVDESQSQCMKSHFPSQKIGKSQFPFYPFRTLMEGFVFENRNKEYPSKPCSTLTLFYRKILTPYLSSAQSNQCCLETRRPTELHLLRVACCLNRS